MSAGAAVSKRTLKLAFSQTAAQAPDLAPDASRLIVADLDLSATPKLINKKVVYESKDRSCVIEAQDVYDNDRAKDNGIASRQITVNNGNNEITCGNSYSIHYQI